ncbi:hypothetical protein LTR28_008980, partial [Elasticomyces elasticus]
MVPRHRALLGLRRWQLASPSLQIRSLSQCTTRLQQAQAREQVQEATTSASSEPSQPHDQHGTKGPAAPAKAIKYTSESYPSLKRDPKFAELTQDDVKYFKDLLGSGSAVIDGLSEEAGEDIEPFNSDWMRKYRGHAKLVVKPGSTEE